MLSKVIYDVPHGMMSSAIKTGIGLLNVCARMHVCMTQKHFLDDYYVMCTGFSGENK